jgi:hypothetical protein
VTIVTIATIVTTDAVVSIKITPLPNNRLLLHPPQLKSIKILKTSLLFL